MDLVAGPADAHQALDSDFCEVRGTLARGKSPLAARLWFGGRYGLRLAAGVKQVIIAASWRCNP